MNKSALFVATLLIATSLTGAGCITPAGAPTISEPGTVTSDLNSKGALKTVTETDDKLKYSVTFPVNMFQSTTFGKEANPGLTSQYYIEENSSGIPNNEKKHTYAIIFSQIDKPLLETIKQDNPSAFEQVLMLMGGGKKPDPSFVAAVNVSGKSGYGVTMGAEGVQTKTYYLNRGTQKTFIIRLNYIGESQVKNMKPSALSEAKQLEYFDRILDSLKFKDTETYTNKAGTFSFEFPTTIFVSTTEDKASLVLQSGYYISDDRVRVGTGKPTYYSINFKEQSGNLEDVMRKENPGFANEYNKIKKVPTKTDPFMEKSMIAGEEAYIFSTSTEVGNETRTAFITHGTKTLIVHLNYLNNVGNPQNPQQILYGEDQLKYWNDVLKSLRFL